MQLPHKVASMPLLKSFSSLFVIHYIDQKKNLTTSMLLLNSFGHIPTEELPPLKYDHVSDSFCCWGQRKH